MSTKFPFNRIEFNLKRERAKAEQQIRDRIDPLCAKHGYKWSKGNCWSIDLGWCKKELVLAVSTVGSVKQPNALGGAGLMLGEMHRIFRRDGDEPPSDRLPTLGAPLYALDERMNSDSGHFNSLAHLDEVLSLFERAVSERAMPELERYQTGDDLFAALLAPDWLTSVKLFASQDRRGALVALMLARREGPERAIEWACAEVERIKNEKPLITSTARYQELLRTVAYLKQAG